MHCHNQVKRSNCSRLKLPGTIVMGIGNFPDILPPMDVTNGPGPFLSVPAPRTKIEIRFSSSIRARIVSAGFPLVHTKLAPRWSIAEPERNIILTPPRPLREPRLASFPPLTSSAGIQRWHYVKKGETPPSAPPGEQRSTQRFCIPLYYRLRKERSGCYVPSVRSEHLRQALCRRVLGYLFLYSRLCPPKDDTRKPTREKGNSYSDCPIQGRLLMGKFIQLCPQSNLPDRQRCGLLTDRHTIFE